MRTVVVHLSINVSACRKEFYYYGYQTPSAFLIKISLKDLFPNNSTGFSIQVTLWIFHIWTRIEIQYSLRHNHYDPSPAPGWVRANLSDYINNYLRTANLTSSSIRIYPEIKCLNFNIQISYNLNMCYIIYWRIILSYTWHHIMTLFTHTAVYLDLI